MDSADTMNLPTRAAAALMAATFFVHVFVGGPETNAPIRGSDLAEITRATALVVWHMVSWMIAVIAAALFWLSRHPNRPLEITLAALQLGMAVLFLWVTVTWFGALLALPQWTVFLIAPALTRWGQGAYANPATGVRSPGPGSRRRPRKC